MLTPLVTNPAFRTKVQTNRLIKARQMLRSLRLKKSQTFNMSIWGEHDVVDGHKPGDNDHCGTAACALGWIDHKKTFRNAPVGKWRKGMYEYTYDLPMARWRRFLGLTVFEFNYLVGPNQYDGYSNKITKSEVIKHFTKVINKTFDPNVDMLTHDLL